MVKQPDYFDRHVMKPKELHKVPNLAYDPEKARQSPAKNKYNGLSSSMVQKFRLRKSSLSRERRKLPKQKERRKFYWEKDLSDEDDYTDHDLLEIPSDQGYLDPTEDSDLDSYEKQKGKVSLENYEFYCRNIKRVQEKRKYNKSQLENPLVDFLYEAEKQKVMMKGMGLMNKKQDPKVINMKSFYDL